MTRLRRHDRRATAISTMAPLEVFLVSRFMVFTLVLARISGIDRDRADLRLAGAAAASAGAAGRGDVAAGDAGVS